MKEEIHSNVFTKSDLTGHSERKNRKFGQKISYITDDLNDIVNVVDILDTNWPLYTDNIKYTFFLNVPETSAKIEYIELLKKVKRYRYFLN